jgi:hypothetical protein
MNTPILIDGMAVLHTSRLRLLVGIMSLILRDFRQIVRHIDFMMIHVVLR